MTCTKHHPKTRHIHAYLLKMAGRRKKVSRDCFITFSTGRPKNARARHFLDMAYSMIRGGVNLFWTFHEVKECILAIENLRRTLDGKRDQAEGDTFVQFCFMQKKFAMDMPRSVLSPAEARRLLDERCGFFRAREGRRAGIHTREQVDKWDPVCKVYPYGREKEAAEDAAFMFAKVWNRPADECLYLTASTFYGKQTWESGLPLG